MTPASGDVVRVAVWTDGHGSHQARCLDCSWKGAWHERASKGQSTEDKAVADAKEHTATVHGDAG